MRHLQTIADLRAVCDEVRARSGRVGLVPTMGALHEGHASLIRAARAQTDLVVVTIFVNPLQFGAGEDLDRYPRDLEGDLAVCEREGADIVFAPSVAEMYPAGPPATTVHVDGLTAPMCGAARPTHFDGVSTVVTKLFAIAGPSRAFFGRKDAQQLAVVARMAADLNLPVEVVGCPIVREPDGLAMSSRNAYLAADERAAALVLNRALAAAASRILDGERDPAVIAGVVADAVAHEPAVVLEYADVRRLHDLTECETPLAGEVLIAVAARVGATRLIDNVTCTVTETGASADLGVTSAGTRSGGTGTPCDG
ncbi:MAG: pantoate--beta-alanine ligase [Actinomycetota bacterium]